MKMQIEQMQIGKIKPFEKNPRRNDDSVDAVANSIKAFGFRAPIIVDRDLVIIAGHTRWKAAKKLQLKTVPVIIAEDMTEEQAQAYRIADNSAGSASTWDDELLQEILADIGTDYDMVDFGLDTEQYIDTGEFPDDIEDDEPPAPPKTAVTKYGQIIHLGEHVLLCGDATRAEDMARLMRAAGIDGGGLDMIMTDPPYNVAIEGETEEHLTIENDDMSDDQFLAFLIKAFGNMGEYLKAGGAFYIWHASMKSHLFREACEETGLTVKQYLEWIKNIFVMGRQDYQWRHEPCIYGWKEGAPHYFIPIRNLSTVEEQAPIDIDALTEQEAKTLLANIIKGAPTDAIHDKKPAASRDHPTMKPVTLLARLIYNSSHQGDTVLDPFGGSGSTMMACEQLHRRCIMMELDPIYCDVIVKRWEALTGNKAERVDA